MDGSGPDGFRTILRERWPTHIAAEVAEVTTPTTYRGRSTCDLLLMKVSCIHYTTILDCIGDSFVMNSKQHTLEMSEPSHEIIDFDSLPQAKQDEFEQLCDLVWHMETDEDARNVFESLKASPELARVVRDELALVVREHGTLLHIACANHRLCMLEMIQYLVDCFPKALQLQQFHGLPLHVACKNSSFSLEVIRYLVEKYPKGLERFDISEKLPLHDACRNSSCSLETARYLVEQNPKALRQGGFDGDLPLHVACEFGSCPLQVVRYLLEEYPNALEQKNDSGMLPLHSCIKCFKDASINFPNLLDRMRLLLPGYPVAIDIASPFHDFWENADWHLWPTPKEHGLYKEVAGLLLEEMEEIPLQDQLEWAKQVVEALSCMSPSNSLETMRSWATEWRDVCRKRLDAIEVRLGELEILLQEFHEN